ncbi:MAG: FCD domain-containing protein [Pseudomonadota bacterium]
MRETVRRLEQKVTAEHLPNRGAVLRSLDRRRVTGLGLIRELLERQRLAQEDREGIDAARRNEVFHPAIRDAAHNGFLINSEDGGDGSPTLLRNAALVMSGRIVAAAQKHGAILDRIPATEGDLTDGAAQHHVREPHWARLWVHYRAREVPEISAAFS